MGQGVSCLGRGSSLWTEAALNTVNRKVAIKIANGKN